MGEKHQICKLIAENRLVLKMQDIQQEQES
jgi:hypothetical protein